MSRTVATTTPTTMRIPKTTRRTTTTSTAARSSRESSCWTTTRIWSTKVGAAEVAAVVVEAAGPVPTTKRPASKPCWKRQTKQHKPSPACDLVKAVAAREIRTCSRARCWRPAPTTTSTPSGGSSARATR
uniref:(northern house mosquito) hypothetical protein n=1 Tax=Culex pipiens TaxID=7175 RepID=A0A8D8BMQ2_CULPI